jgi:CTP:molybdopterin cytidylyltransferase MocA
MTFSPAPLRSGVACAILAAGASRRLGQPKQLLRIDDQPLIRRIASVALASRADAVAVLLGAHADRIARALGGLPALETLLVSNWADGLSASVRAAAGWARRRGARALLLAVGDQLALTTDRLDALIAASDGGRRLVASTYGGVRGVPALIPSAHFPSLGRLTGDVGARELLRAAGPEVTEVHWPAGARDIDERADVPVQCDAPNRGH